MTENLHVIKHRIKLVQDEENGPVMVALDNRLYRCYVQDSIEKLTAGVGIMRLNLVIDGWEERIR